MVLLAALGAFLLLAVLLPYSLRRYYLTATVPRAGTLETIVGTVRVSRQGGSADVAASAGETILEGFSIKTDNTSRALLTLFDSSTIYIFENTDLTVKEMRSSRFTNKLTLVSIFQKLGQMRVGVAPPATNDGSVSVETPQGVIDLGDGSYSVEVSPAGTSVSVRAGSAEVTGQHSTVTINRDQRTTIANGQAPGAPAPAALDLVLNGDFHQRDVGWTSTVEVEAGRRDDILGATTFLTEAEGGPGVYFVRKGSANSHGENSISQSLDRDVSDFVSLRLSLDFKLLYQSLSGGGYLGSEYPLLVSIIYRDAKGAQFTWSRGFYYQNDAGYPTTYGEQAPVDVWIPYEKDLFALQGYPKPFRLLSVEVVASGWDYESVLRSISILAE